MKIIDVTKLEPKRVIKDPSGAFISNRILIESDGMGYSLTKTIISKSNKKHFWHYKKHLESCYCISGYGIITNIKTNISYDITQDKIYVLDQNDPHYFQAIEDTILICVFNPPLKGNELHKEDGSYE